MNYQRGHFPDGEWCGKMKLQNSVLLDCRFMHNLLAEDTILSLTIRFSSQIFLASKNKSLFSLLRLL